MENLFHVYDRALIIPTSVIISDHPICLPVKIRMDETQRNFWVGTGIGAVIIILIDLLVRLMGSFIRGFVAGYLAKGDFLNAGNAGLLSGF